MCRNLILMHPLLLCWAITIVESPEEGEGDTESGEDEGEDEGGENEGMDPVVALILEIIRNR